MAGDDPAFSVVVATYNRGVHIRPTLASALDQSFGDFEVIVVADGCTDDTLEVVHALNSPKIRTYALRENSGGQSAPNNLGIERSRGRYVAYLGHDDIWHPDHLAGMAAAFAAPARPDVVAGGCLYHGPIGSGVFFVTGLLDEEHQAADHFLPPSALSHTRALVERIGPWAQPERVAPPVDAEFVLRADGAGARFASTGTIGVHKFAAGHRYLSYLHPQSHEQAAMLAALRSFGRTNAWSFAMAAARRQGRSMAMQHVDYARLREGDVFRANRSNKGLDLPPLRPLDGAAVLTQTGEPRGLDWHALEGTDRPYRWSGPSPRARVLIPFTGAGDAHLALDLLEVTPDDVLESVAFACAGTRLAHTVTSSQHACTIELELPLSSDAYSVLEIETPVMICPHERTGGGDTRRLGIALGDITIAPRFAPAAR